jgi:ABC-type sugar transport system permease subunit
VIVGLKNFISIFTNESIRSSFFKIFRWTMGWGFFSVMLTFTLGMSLALLVNNKELKGKPIYRNLLIIPYSIPFFISVLVFRGMFNQDFGIINDAVA